MQKIKLKDVKRGAMFYTLRDYEKHGDDEMYVRVRGSYDRSTKKYYTFRPYRDAIGNGRDMRGDVEVICDDNLPTVFIEFC